MGKATILEHKGDGLYSVRLTKSSLHITDRLAAIEIDLQAVEADIQAAGSQIEVDEASLSARKAEIDEEIGRINAKYAELSATIRAERDELKAAVDSLRVAQEFLDYLEQLEEDGVEVGKQQMDYAEEQVAKKTAERDAVQDRLNAHQTEWADREKDLTAIGALVKSSAELTESARIARMMLADLVNQRTQLMADRLWLMGKMPGEETVDAWCADLTTGLEGTVGTIEAMGERVHQTGTLLVRPGYDGGADYKAAGQFKPLIDALSAAQVETLRAVERVDAAEAALDANRRRIDDLTRQLADLLERPQQTDDEYGYLQDLDGNPIPQPRGITPAEIVFVQGQLDAAQKQTPYLESSLAIIQESLATAREAYTVASDALDAAREAEKKPRDADGLLQSVAAAPGPFSWFFNQALLPAVEKWRPLYRLGEITILAGDHCTVALDAAKSSQGEIDLNRDATLSDVPIRYMECNGAAFEIGDRVVVEFEYHDQNSPVVIGFEREPKACVKLGFWFDVRGRPAGGDNIAPKRLGAQAYIPTPEHPAQPPSPHDPWGYYPADDDAELEYLRVSFVGSAWAAAHRQKPNDALVFGNRRYHAWDGSKYLGCLSWRQKPAFGGEWFSTPGTWAGPIIPSGQTPPPPESDYMVEKDDYSLNFAHGDIAYAGRLILRSQMLTSGLAGISGMRVVAACIVRVPLPIPPGSPPGTDPPTELRLRVITWHWAQHATKDGDVSPYGYKYPSAQYKPRNWRTYTEFVKPSKQLFVCWEGPLDAEDEPSRRAGMVKIAQFSGVDPVWVPNPNDSTAFSTTYIDASDAVRPETPLGQFSKSGTKASAIYVGGRFWLHNVLSAQIYTDWAWGMGALVRFDWPIGGAPSATFETQEGEQVSGWTMQAAEIYTPETDWQTVGNTWISTGYTRGDSRVAVAVDYDGETEILLWYRYSGSETTSRQTVVDGSSMYELSTTVTHTLSSTNNKISIVVADQASGTADEESGQRTSRGTVLLIHAVDLVAGEVFYTKWTAGSDESVAPNIGYRQFLSRAVTIYRGSTQLLHDETYEAGQYGNANPFWDGFSYGGPWSQASTSYETTAPWGHDVTRGHREYYHYGSGPTVAYARDQAGHFVGAISYNQWAPLVSYPGYRTAGGFVPNTTTTRVFSSDDPPFDQFGRIDKLTGLDWVIRSIAIS